MAFTDLLSDPTNQIRVLPGASPDNSLEASIKGLSGIAGSLIATVKEKSDEKLRDKIIGGLQTEFLDLTESYKQGNLSEKEMNLRMDTRMKQVRADNPWIASDISKWVKEDLGLQPRGNAFVDQRAEILKEEEMNDAMFAEAQKNGLVVKDKDGKINRQKSIDTMQDINRAVLFAGLEAKRREGRGQLTAAQEAAAVATPLRQAYQKSVGPILSNILDVTDKMVGTEAEKLAAAKELMAQSHQQFIVKAMQPVVNGSTLTSDGIQGIRGEFDSLFKENDALLFGDDYGAFKRQARTLSAVVDSGVTDMKFATSQIQIVKGALGERATDPVITQAMLTANAADGMVGDIRQSLAMRDHVNNVIEVNGKTKELGSLTPAEQKEVTATNQHLVEALVTADKLSDKELITFTNSIYSYATAGSQKNSVDSQTRSLTFLNKPAIFDKLGTATSSSLHANGARETLDKTLTLSKDFLTDQRIPALKTIREETVTDFGQAANVVFNEGAGKFELKLNEAVLRKQATKLGQGTSGGSDAVYRRLLNGFTSSKEIVNQLNNALNVASMSYRTMNKGTDDVVVKKTLVESLGYPTNGTNTSANLKKMVEATAKGEDPQQQQQVEEVAQAIQQPAAPRKEIVKNLTPIIKQLTEQGIPMEDIKGTIGNYYASLVDETSDTNDLAALLLAMKPKQ